jgi:hypothetical protein
MWAAARVELDLRDELDKEDALRAEALHLR